MATRRLGAAVIAMAGTLAMTGGGPSAGQSTPASPLESSPAPLTGGPSPRAQCTDSQVSEADQRAIAQPWIDALWSFYATGDDGELTRLATPQGLERLRTVDWRFQAVESGAVRFREAPEIVEFYDSFEWCTSGTDLVALDLDSIIRIGPGAITLDAALDTPIEAVGGEYRRGVKVSFIQAPGTDDWLVDDVTVSAFPPDYRESRPAIPCPGLGDPRRASDPFLMKPWCTANGDGRKVPEWTGRPGGELGIGRPSCWPGAHQMILGLPPGTPLDRNVGTYVRDPRGTARGSRGFRLDFRPPKDAISTGITNGYATIWTSEKLGDSWLLVQVGDRFERWPAHDGRCGN